jgi:SAM-dependent methyltransferase
MASPYDVPTTVLSATTGTAKVTMGLLDDLKVRAVHELNRFLRRLTAWMHGLEFRMRWQSGREAPEWFDHNLDVQFLWPSTGNTIALERGAFGHFAVRHGDRVMDICSGDGFYCRHFWSPRASEVVGVDRDRAALAHARRNNSAPNVTFLERDLLVDELPEGPFDAVTWNAGIEHFEEDEILQVLRKAKRSLNPGGILAGTTDIHGEGGYVWHKREFRDADDLAQLLAQEFAHVTVETSEHPNRKELLFYASDDPARIPFRDFAERRVTA